MDTIKLLVAHADPLARAGLSYAFRNNAGFEVLENPATAVPVFGPACAVDVIVADYANGIAIASRLEGGRAGACKVVIVGGSDREFDIRRALESGVRGYLLAGCTLDELADGIRAVHRGIRHLSPQAAARLAENVYSERLTDREEEVLRLVTHGLPNKTIANRLGIAIGTVKSHLKSTFEKLNVRSRTQALAIVEQRGLLAGE